MPLVPVIGSLLTIFDTSQDVLYSCSIPTNQTITHTCNYIRTNCDSLRYKYLEIYYCSYNSVHPIWGNLLLVSFILFSLTILFLILSLLASDYLVANLTSLSESLHLGEKLAGLTLLAFANGSPDIFSTYIAMNSNSTSLAIGELLGSANFSLTVVIGGMIIAAPFEVDYETFIKDVMVFSILILVSLFFLSDGCISIYESIALCLLYVGFMIHNIFFPENISKSSYAEQNENQLGNDQIFEVEETENVTENDNDICSNFRPSLSSHESASSMGYINFSHNVENLEQGRSFRLSILDSIRLAIISWKKSLKYKLWNNTNQPSHEMQSDIERCYSIPNRIIITKPSENNLNPVSETDPLSESSRKLYSPEVELSNEESEMAESWNGPKAVSNLTQTNLLLPRPALRNSSSIDTQRSTTSLILVAADMVPIDAVDYKPTTNIFYKLIPIGSVLGSNNYYEAFFSIIILPFSFLFNLCIPVPIPGEIKDDAREQEQLLNIKLFHLQLFLTPFIIHTELSFITFSSSIGISILNISFQLINRALYVKCFDFFYALLGFINVLRAITLTASGVIMFLKDMGQVYHLKESILGLTLLSLGNSVGDLVTNITLSSLGLPLTGLHACFGSPLLYILFGIGSNSLIVNIREHKEIKFEVDQNLKVTAYSIIFTLVFYIITIPMCHWKTEKWMGFIGIFIWLTVTLFNIYEA